MNFLAHAFLSFNDPEILTGNMIGDFIKGKNYEHLPINIQKGVLLHRKIDSFTDSHDTFKKTVFRISEQHGKYRFVIADLFYDHFLAKNWNKFHSTELIDFTKHSYSVLNKQSIFLPEKFKFALNHMEKNNWLYNYQFLDKLELFIKGVSNRSKYGVNLETSIHDLEEDYHLFEEDFIAFFPEVISFSKSEISL